jgi:hypothetical protein
MKGTAMTDVEQVARALAAQAGYDPDETWEEFDRNAAASVSYFGEYEGWQDVVFLKHVRWHEFVAPARAAMAATRRIDAAVVRDRFNLWHDAEEIADWLEARAKEVCDAD